MQDNTPIRMLFTTAVVAAVAALMTTSAQASWMDVEGGGGSGAAVVTPTAQPQTIPYLSHGVGVDESFFAGQPEATSQPLAIPYLSQGVGVDASRFTGQQTVAAPPDWMERYAARRPDASTLALGGSPDAIDRFVANQQASTLALGGSPDAIDRYVANQQASTLALGGSPDAIDRYLGKTTVAAQAGTSGSEFNWTLVGLGAGFCAFLAVAMAGLYLAGRQRGRIALP